jgi:hypothetical protein
MRYTTKSGHSEHELADPYHEHYVNMSPYKMLPNVSP